MHRGCGIWQPKTWFEFCYGKMSFQTTTCTYILTVKMPIQYSVPENEYAHCSLLFFTLGIYVIPLLFLCFYERLRSPPL